MFFKEYIPDKITLERYSDLMINFALNGGKGVKKGETILLQVPQIASSFIKPLQKTALKAGANIIIDIIPNDEVTASFFEHANQEQLNYTPKDFLTSKANQIDHLINVIADDNPSLLKNIDKSKLIKRSQNRKFYREILNKKESEGKFSWTLCLYGTKEMAKKANLSTNKYWKQIIKACHLDSPKPVKIWRQKQAEVAKIKQKLDNLNIENLHIKSENIDLSVKIGENRKWLGCSGRNIPSFEVFISPDWRKTEGNIFFNQPVYIFDEKVEGIELTFKKGRVTKYKAKTNQGILNKVFSIKNADKIGEFSLTDKDFSLIDTFMAETLYDENRGGEYGNMHLAIGASYKDSYKKADKNKLTKKDWSKMGYNESMVHIDIVNTEPKIVEAKTKDGKTIVIYKNGKFLV